MNVRQAALRGIGAALLGTTAGIHGYLYTQGYRSIHLIGPLFALLVLSASVLALGLVAVPARAAVLVAGLGAALEAGSAAAAAYAVRPGLLGFVESTRATLYWPSLWVEVGATVVLLGLVVTGRRPSRAGRGVGGGRRARAASGG